MTTLLLFIHTTHTNKKVIVTNVFLYLAPFSLASGARLNSPHPNVILI